MRLHRTYEQLLARSDELTEGERQRLLAHLGTCERCRQEQRVLRERNKSLRHFVAKQPPISLEAAVLARIRNETAPTAVPVVRSRARLLPAAAGLVLAASVFLAAGLTLGPRLTPHPGTPTAVAMRQNCTVTGASWALKGPCQIVSSPTALRSPGVTYYPLALQWAKQHVHNPRYIIRRNDRLPALIRHSGTTVYISEVAKDSQSHRSVYVVGEEQ